MNNSTAIVTKRQPSKLGNELNLNLTVAPLKTITSFDTMRSPKLSIFTRRMLEPTVTIDERDLQGGTATFAGRKHSQKDTHYYLMMKPPTQF